MRRFLATLGLAGILVGVAVLARGISPAGVVGACAWRVENVNSNVQGPYADTWTQSGTDKLVTTLATWTDDCSGKQYEAFIYWAGSTPASYTDHVRVWVCGAYQGEWSSSTTVVWSPAFNYHWPCGRQADNDNSSEYSVYVPYGTIYNYVNQG